MAGKRQAANLQKKADALERSKRALELALEGKRPAEIAEVVGGTRTGVYRLINRAFAEIIREPAEHLLALEVARIDAAWAANWPKVLEGHVPAILAAVRLSQHRCKLLGIRKPVEVDLGEIVAQVAAEFSLTAEESAQLEHDVTVHINRDRLTNKW